MLTNRFAELNWLTKKKTNENKRISVNYSYTEKFDYRITNIDAHSRSEAVYKALVTVKELLVEIKSLQNDEQ